MDTTPQREDVDDCSLLVAPAVDARYRDEDSLPTAQGETLMARSIAKLRSQAQTDNAPVLLTRTADDEFTAQIETAADHYLRCEYTEMVPRFVGDEFETLVYPVGDGTFYQTTIAYWRQVLEVRGDQAGFNTAGTPSPGGSDIGDEVPGDESVGGSMADPLVDAWMGSEGL